MAVILFFVDDDSYSSSSSSSSMQETHSVCSYAKLFQFYYELHLLSDIFAVVKI